jgi:hypothetical protein
MENNFEIDFSFVESNKENTAPQIFRNLFKEKAQNKDQILLTHPKPKLVLHLQ